MTRTKGRYLGRSGEVIEVAGREVAVTAHWAEVDGNAVCVGLDLRTFSSRNAARCDLNDAKPLQGWAEVGTEVVRGLRVAEAVEQSRQDLLGLLSAAVAEAPALRPVLSRKPEPHKRGPQTQWTPEVLREVVAPAYRAGGRKRAEAVQAALEAHRGEVVTYEQAKHGIRAARLAGLIAPANRKRSSTTGASTSTTTRTTTKGRAQ
jgi:hypothetical protein